MPLYNYITLVNIYERRRGFNFHSWGLSSSRTLSWTPPHDDNGTVACAVKLKLHISRAAASERVRLLSDQYHEHARQSWSNTQVKAK